MKPYIQEHRESLKALNLDGTGELVLLGSEPNQITWEMKDDIIIIKDSSDLVIEADIDDGIIEFDVSVLGTGFEFKLAKKGLFQ